MGVKPSTLEQLLSCENPDSRVVLVTFKNYAIEGQPIDRAKVVSILDKTEFSVEQLNELRCYAKRGMQMQFHNEQDYWALDYANIARYVEFRQLTLN